MTAGLAGCGNSTAGTVTLDFFQYKAEAADWFTAKAKEFEKTHPNIKVNVNNSSDATTDLRTRLVKNREPDVITINGDINFGMLAEAGVFHDFTDDDIVDELNPGMVNIAKSLVQTNDESKKRLYGLPYAGNASGYIINADVWEQAGEDPDNPPQTWSEFIDLLQRFKSKGIVPIEASTADPWTLQAPLASLNSTLVPESEYLSLKDGSKKFSDLWGTVSDQLVEIYQNYTQKNPAVTYQQATQDLAADKAAILPLGTYAIPQIRLINSDANLRFAQMPATDNAEEQQLTAGDDVILTMGAHTKHEKEVREFIDFLMNDNVIGNPRTFREIYLKPFEIVIKEAQPWTVMTSYNLINGTMSSERCDLITEILRHEWGFKGMVMTDWFGGISAAAQMEAGNDLLMPGKADQVKEIRKVVLNGRLSMEILDRNVRHILEYIMQTPRFKQYVADNNPDLKGHALVARNAATEGMVLLKNNKNVLPLVQKIKTIALFGNTSYDFIAGGTGSGNVNHAYVVSLLDGLKNAGYQVDDDIRKSYIEYAPKAKANLPKPKNPLEAFLPGHFIPEMSLAELNMSAAVKNNDMAIITIGKSSGEFLDRKISDSFNLTKEEKDMISGVCNAFHKAGKKVVVILNVCGVIETKSWIAGPDAVLLSWLPGQEGGNCVADILAGKENPSGRLPMTWPVSYNDVPSKADFPNPETVKVDDVLGMFMGKGIGSKGDVKNVDYTEYNDGVYVGYRYYQTKNVPVSFPFGYGMSYTTFKYGKPVVTKDAQGNIKVLVTVKNAGKVAGKEVVQVYVAAPGKDMDKPARELRGFAKTKNLQPGESETVSIDIPYKNLASFNEIDSQWQVEAGDYKVMVAKNAADLKPLTTVITEEAGVTEKVRPCLLPEVK